MTRGQSRTVRPLQRRAPYVHLYHVTNPEDLAVEIDDDLDERLRALGYIGEEPEPIGDKTGTR